MFTWNSCQIDCALPEPWITKKMHRCSLINYTLQGYTATFPFWKTIFPFMWQFSGLWHLNRYFLLLNHEHKKVVKTFLLQLSCCSIDQKNFLAAVVIISLVSIRLEIFYDFKRFNWFCIWFEYSTNYRSC